MTISITGANVTEAATAVTQYCNENSKGKAKQGAVREALSLFMGYRDSNTALGDHPPQASPEMSVLALNLFDNTGNVIGTQHVGVSMQGINDIIDHAAQLVRYLRASMPDDMTVVDVEADSIFSELTEALEVYGVIPSKKPVAKEAPIVVKTGKRDYTEAAIEVFSQDKEAVARGPEHIALLAAMARDMYADIIEDDPLFTPNGMLSECYDNIRNAAMSGDDTVPDRYKNLILPLHRFKMPSYLVDRWIQNAQLIKNQYNLVERFGKTQSADGIVTFHDRGTGNESRLIVDGKIQFRLVDGDDPMANEMLYQALFDEVEQKLANGETKGLTSDPCYPEWMFIPPKS